MAQPFPKVEKYFIVIENNNKIQYKDLLSLGVLYKKMSTLNLLITASRYGGELKQDEDPDDMAKTYDNTHEAVDDIKNRLHNFIIRAPDYLPTDELSQPTLSFLEECTSLEEIAMFINVFCCDDAGYPDFTWCFIQMQKEKLLFNRGQFKA